MVSLTTVIVRGH